MELGINEIINELGGQIVFPAGDNLKISNVLTDSRLIREDTDYGAHCFVCLKGERFDGNKFAVSAIKAGFGLVITSLGEEELKNEIKTAEIASVKSCVLSVADTLWAFGKLGYLNRKKFENLRTVGITGSVGKTTTKEFIYHVLSHKFNTIKTSASRNNEIGVPETLMSIAPENEVFACEMGMRGLGQIKYLSGFVLPQIGVITNIGCAHLELLGTKDNTMRAKLEIAEFADVLVLNGDDERLGNRKAVDKIVSEYRGGRPYETIYFGFGENCDIKAKNIEIDGEKSKFDIYAYEKFAASIALNAPGVHCISAALAAAAVALYLGMENEEIKAALESFSGEMTGRQKIERLESEITLIDDSFNAGPESMKASLSLLAAVGKGRKVAFLGDMLELGDYSAEEHRGVGEFCAKAGIDLLVTCGDLAKNIGLACASKEKGTMVVSFDTTEEACQAVSELVMKGDTILVKASHAMNFNKIAEKIREI